MKKIQKQYFEDIIVNEETIIRITDYFFGLKPVDEARADYLNVEMFDTDGIEYTFTENDSISDLKEILSYNKISHISFRFRDYSLDEVSYCSLTLTATSHSSYVSTGNIMKVEGGKVWSTLKFDELKELTKSFIPQNNFFRKYYTTISIVLTVTLSLFVTVFILISKDVDLIENYMSVLLMFLLLAIFFYTLISIFLNNWVNKVFPNIEFNFGPTHLQAPKKVREKIVFIFSIFLIPLLYAILF